MFLQAACIEAVEILGICLDNINKGHIKVMLNRVFAKIGALRSIQCLVPANTMLLESRSEPEIFFRSLLQ